MVEPEYTREELKLFISKITSFTVAPHYMRSVLSTYGPSELKVWMYRAISPWYHLMYSTPYENLPLLINKRNSDNEMIIVKWRLGIGK